MYRVGFYLKLLVFESHLLIILKLTFILQIISEMCFHMNNILEIVKLLLDTMSTNGLYFFHVLCMYVCMYIYIYL